MSVLTVEPVRYPKPHMDLERARRAAARQQEVLATIRKSAAQAKEARS